jgi:hypothetical protein
MIHNVPVFSHNAARAGIIIRIMIFALLHFFRLCCVIMAFRLNSGKSDSQLQKSNNRITLLRMRQVQILARPEIVILDWLTVKN